MTDDTVCDRCGERIPPNESACPYCAGSRPFPFLHREPVLIAAIFVLAAGLWLVAHGATEAYGHRQDHLARTWYADGERAMITGNYHVAIADLQTALVYSHDNANVRLRLAEALGAAGRIRQAQAYLEALWAEQPANATVNLQLARLAARTGDIASAERYFNDAIFGIWANDPVENRRSTRFELVRFLLARNQFQQAQAQLIALAADEPTSPELIVEIGRLFLQAGDAGRALQQYQLAIRKQPRNAAALAGAGQAAFQLANYSTARRYLQRATALDPADARAAELLNISELVLQLDPFAPRIGRDERARRVVANIGRTLNRLTQCATQTNVDLSAQPPVNPPAQPAGSAAAQRPAKASPAATQKPAAQPAANAAAKPPMSPIVTDYQQLTAMQKQATVRGLIENPDLVDTAMDLVFRSQDDAASVCGPPTGDDFAIILIARANGGLQ